MLTGGAGADTFIFRPGMNEGADTITDFDMTRDRLDFRGVVDRGAPGLADDLSALATLTDANGDVSLAFGAGTRIVFSGIGTGGMDELAELVTNPGAQILGWGALVG